MWGVAVTDFMFLTERNTGAICPSGWYVERMIPIAQLITVACDAWIVAQIGNLCHDRDNRSKVWRLLGLSLLSSAAILAFLAFWSFFEGNNFIWSLSLTWVSIRDLVLDSTGVAAAVISSVYLLGFVHPMTIGLTIALTSVFAHIQDKTLDGSVIKIWSHWWGLTIGIVIFLAPGVLLRLGTSDTDRSRTHPQSLIYRYGHMLYAALAFALVAFLAVLINPTRVQSPPTRLIASARIESDDWISSAKKSSSLDTAIMEYRERYGMPPPPHFDKWYTFATEAESPIIDTFDQIHSDLLPFWGLRPADIRQRTAHLLEHPRLSIGGIIIKNGQVEISPHIRGTHRWMMDVTKSMIDPFAQWLPDMQLAFNLDDECRISVPYQEMSILVQDGLASQSKLGAQKRLLSFSETQSPPWSEEYLGLDETAWEKESPLFVVRSRSAIFNEWISPSCPLDSAVNEYHWWNRKAECVSCSAPHMPHGFISNWTLSGDLCHQPDLAYLHGFLSSPSALAPSHTLFPIFSQGRVQSFADILYPSPWNYGDKVGFEKESSSAWEEKLDSVYWRGALSDGSAIHGAWQTFVRARFVYMFTKASTSIRRGLDSLVNHNPTAESNSHHRRSISALSHWAADSPSSPSRVNAISQELGVAVNVSFIGDFTRCDQRDCRAEHTTFYGSATAEPPPALDFQEHLKHRHLVDLDGAGYSGRFPPFLESGSLPYRAALFRTWWEERVHAWRHFVPLDLRLHELRDILDYLGTSSLGKEDAVEMARAGQEWAGKAMRKEDMRVYMFRLLLEWGRVVDDERESLGFDI